MRIDFNRFANLFKETEQHKPEGFGYTVRAHLFLNMDDQPLSGQRYASAFEMYNQRFFENGRLSNARKVKVS